MWVEYWLEQIDPEKNLAEVSADQREDGIWVCEIQLPLIEKKVVVESSTEVIATTKASNQAAMLINKYMADHPELEIKNPYIGKPFEIETYPDGRIRSISLTDEYRRKEGKCLYKTMSTSLSVVEKAVSKIKKVLNNNNIFIQVIDKRLVGDMEDSEYLSDKLIETIEKAFGTKIIISSWCVKDDLIICVGHTL